MGIHLKEAMPVVGLTAAVCLVSSVKIKSSVTVSAINESPFLRVTNSGYVKPSDPISVCTSTVTSASAALMDLGV